MNFFSIFQIFRITLFDNDYICKYTYHQDTQTIHKVTVTILLMTHINYQITDSVARSQIP